MDREVCCCAPCELGPLTCVLRPPLLLAVPLCLIYSSAPEASAPFSPFLCVSTLLVRAVPLRQHLPVPYNKFSPLVAPFLADVTSSEQEPCPPHRRRSLGPGRWWVLLNGRMSGWAQALIPELHLVPSCFCPQCPAPSPKPMSRGLVWMIPTVGELTMEDLPNRMFMQPITTVLTMSIKCEDAGLDFFYFLFFTEQSSTLKAWFKCHLLRGPFLISPTRNNLAFPGLPEHLPLPLAS